MLRHRLYRNRVYRKYIAGGLSGLLIVMATTVVVADSVTQTAPHYLAQGDNDQSNPWALPKQRNPYPEQRSDTGLQWQPKYQDQGYENGRLKNRTRQERFVTPETLRSLNQIQGQPPTERQSKPQPLPPVKQQQYSMPPRGAPPYGMGYSPPMYDMPAGSPWESSPDILYRKGADPMVPNEAIGGIAPMQPLLFGGDNPQGLYTPELQEGNNVFNPFTFIPNEGR